MPSFDEFKFLVESTVKLSERRQTATQTYLGVCTAIFGVLAFLVKDAGFRGWGLIAVSAPLYAAGAVACVVWLRIISDLRKVIGWRYEQVRQAEEGMPADQRIYTKEWERFYKGLNGHERMGFSNLEAWLPRLFLGLYVLYAVGIAVAVAVGWL